MVVWWCAGVVVWWCGGVVRGCGDVGVWWCGGGADPVVVRGDVQVWSLTVCVVVLTPIRPRFENGAWAPVLVNLGRGFTFGLKSGRPAPPCSNSSASAPRPVAGTPRPREEQITWRGRPATRVFTHILALCPLVETKNL